MPSSITINGITGTSPYNITLCDTDPVSPTCVWIAQITDLDLPYTFTPPISLQYTTSFLVKIVDAGFPCTIITPPILRTLNPCYPVYVDAANNEVYSFDPSSYLTSSYFDPGVQIDAMTRSDDKLWIFDSSQGWIYEYDTTGYTTPTIIRQIDTTYSSIDIYGMCVYSSTELLSLSSTGDVNIIDISTNTASKSFLYSIVGTPQNDCNLLRDDNIGITYMKTSLTGLKAFYDDGTQYSTATWPSGNQKGFFRDSSTAEIYGVNNTGGVYKIPQPPGSVTPSSVTTISPDNLVSGGLGQSNSCIPGVSSITISLRNATAYTMNFTASSFTWINWGDSDYVSGGTSGTINRSKTYSPAFTGDVTLNSYNLESITGFSLLDSLPIGSVSPILNTNQLSGLTNLSYYLSQSYCLTKGLVKYLPDSINTFISFSSSLTGDTSDFPTGMTYCSISNSSITLTGNVANLPINLEVIFIANQSFSGNVSGFPSNLVWLRLDGTDKVSGDTSGLPPNLKYVWLTTSLNTISGNTSGLPLTLSFIYIGGYNTISGDTSGLPDVDYSYVPENNNFYLTPTVSIGGNNTISGNTSGLPRKVRNLSISGFNTISGDTSGLPQSASTVEIRGNNTISGDTSGLPLTANTRIYGFNIISGDVGDLPHPSFITSDGFTEPGVIIQGDNTISGEISGISTNLKVIQIIQRTSSLTGNTITGNISGLSGHTNLRTMLIEGANTIFGDIQYLPPNLTYLNLKGYNTISGNVADIPSSVTNFEVYGNNTISGDISGIPPISYFRVEGNNAISGGFSGFPSGINRFILSGGSIDTSSGSTNGMVFPNNMCIFSYTPTGSGLNQYDVDNILVSATAATWTTTSSCSFGKYISLQGTNAAPSALGLAAKAILTGYSITVYTN